MKGESFIFGRFIQGFILFYCIHWLAKQREYTGRDPCFCCRLLWIPPLSRQKWQASSTREGERKKSRRIGVTSYTDRESQWGRRLEGWSNTAARLAGWGRVTRQVWFCTWWTGRTACLFSTVPVDLTGAAQLRSVEIFCCLNIEMYTKHARKAWPGTLV